MACKCKLPTVEEAKEGSTAIFEGRAIKVEDEPQVEGGAPPGKLYTFSIVRTWKALENQELVKVRTNESSAMCGYTFDLDSSYLIYAGGSLDALEVTTCSRTRPMSEASEDLGPLGVGVTPVKIESAADAGAAAPPKTKSAGCSASCASGKSGSATALLWLALPAFGLVLRRRER